MPRPLRVPDETERETLHRISEINDRIARNLRANSDLSAERRQIVRSLMADGWSMYGIARETGITPNTVKRIVEADK